MSEYCYHPFNLHTEVYSSWPIRLPEIFNDIGLINVEVNNRLFPDELLPFQLDTALMASEEVSYKALDPVSKDLGDSCRDLISKAFQHRQRVAYSVG